MERTLIEEYKETVMSLGTFDPDTAQKLAELPQDIRGFGHVKLASVEATKAKRNALLSKPV